MANEYTQPQTDGLVQHYNANLDAVPKFPLS
jgi:hypothetical protein